MLYVRENGSEKIYADTYCLEFAADRPFVCLSSADKTRIADLFFLSSVHPLSGRDDTLQLNPWRVEETLNEVVFSMDAQSSTWLKKTYRFRCFPQRFLYEIEVYGNGEICEASYFGGYSSAQPRWGSGFFWSGQQFIQGFNPEPNCAEKYTFSPEANSSINLTGVPLPGRDDWFFTPPPYCFAVQTNDRWMGLGVEAKPGENQYNEFQYHGCKSAFFLSLHYDGHVQVKGNYRLPAIAFEFAPDPYTVLQAHVDQLQLAGKVNVSSPQVRPEWWSEPIFCGWGSQNFLSQISGSNAKDYANQASYEAFLHTLSAKGIDPGTIVIDDKWQLAYGTNTVDTRKWPDLPGFIRTRHEAGQHVLLWLKAWDPDGIPAEECITNACGLPLAVDPTNPIFEQRLRETICYMLSSEGLGADGFKLDFSARIPCGPAITTHSGDWGLELMRRYLEIIHDAAKLAKPDALIMTHTPHPYLAGLMDIIRLNDINTNQDICQQMTHRARVAAIACPQALIDMDNWPVQNKAAWRDYLVRKPLLGVPSLYFASHIDSTQEALTDEDYALIREVWAEYRANHVTRQNGGDKLGQFSGGANQTADYFGFPFQHPLLVNDRKKYG
jgi:hypothetical protein